MNGDLIVSGQSGQSIDATRALDRRIIPEIDQELAGRHVHAIAGSSTLTMHIDDAIDCTLVGRVA